MEKCEDDLVSHNDEQSEDIDISDRWSLLAHNFGEVPTFHQYVHFDDDLAVTGTLTDSGIFAADDEHNDGEEGIEEHNSVPISTNEAKVALQTLRQYFERTEDVLDEVFAVFISIENRFDRIRWAPLTQKTRFFSKSDHVCTYILLYLGTEFKK